MQLESFFFLRDINHFIKLIQQQIDLVKKEQVLSVLKLKPLEKSLNL